MTRLIGPYVLSILLFAGSTASGQHKYWLDHTSLATLSVTLPEPDRCSEWLNACTYTLNEDQRSAVTDAGGVLTPMLSFAPAALAHKVPILSFALEQIQANYFLKMGLTGKGVKIGIIDGGFLRADRDPTLSHLFQKGLVKSYKDYITPEMEAYGGAIGLDDNHGTEVWQLIGGYDKEKNILYGLAQEAEYYLARTDHGAYEKRIEEDLLILALEDMERQGIRLVNVSLGYNLGYSDASENYRPSQMDGKSTAIARAVEIAATQKGMLIVVAAGNEARDSWQTLSTPGDAQHALTVGASKFDIWDKMDYSSIGPDYTDFVKPDISVYSTLGTSYSTPVVTGLVACIWQMDSTLTNLEIIDILKQAGNFYPYPNNYLGYGVPTCPNIIKIMSGETIKRPQKVKTSKESYRLTRDLDTKYLVAFHKKDERNVMARVVYRPMGNKIKIKRITGARQTSLLIGTEVIEIFWE
jgi:subtilisin family serine protease